MDLFKVNQEENTVSINRNGAHLTSGISVKSFVGFSGRRLVEINAITSRGNLATGDITIEAEAMDKLAAEWIKMRGSAFTQPIEATVEYDGQQFKASVHDVGIDIGIVTDDHVNSVAYLDLFYLGREAGGPKDGYPQIVLCDHRDELNGAGPIACAVMTDRGMIVHAGDAGIVTREGESFGFDRWHIAPNKDMECDED